MSKSLVPSRLVVKQATSFIRMAVMCCCPCAFAFADLEVNLNLTADGDARWYEFFSDAFAEIDQGFNNETQTDGFFLISSDPSVTVPANNNQPISRNNNTPVYEQVGSGADVFPNEGSWTSIGTILVDDSVLTNGSGDAPITAFSAEFDQHIADNDAIVNQGYVTTVNSVAGSVKFENGSVIGFDLRADITFTYDGFVFGFGTFDFDGVFQIGNGPDQHGTNFDLYVDSSYDVDGFLSPVRYIWDATGVASSQTTAPVPAPILPVQVETSFTDGDLTLSFPTNIGNFYQIKWTPDLTTGGSIQTWNDLGDLIVGDGTVKQFIDTDSSEQDQRFYAIIISN
ncbi:MAG: hypothetical protein AAGH40_07420 [Verrucomicrobiota bacterium]